MNDNAKKWVAALRSGEFKQTQKALTRVDDNGNIECCCLGVACELFNRENPGLVDIRDEENSIGERTRRYSDESALLPPGIVDWLGLFDRNGSYRTPDNGRHCLSEDNDNGASFEDIATTIEANPKGLFR